MELEHLVKQGENDGKEKNAALFLLHGIGSNEQDLYSFAPYLPKETTIISCRAPMSYGFGGYAWYNIDWLPNGDKISDIEQAKSSLKILTDFIKSAIDAYHLNPEKVSICGFSQGCILGLALFLSKPKMVRNFIGMSGYHNNEIAEDAGPKELNGKKVFISHGTMDDVIPVSAARKTRAHLENLGLDVEYHEFPSAHGVSSENFNAMLNFVQKNCL